MLFTIIVFLLKTNTNSLTGGYHYSLAQEHKLYSSRTLGHANGAIGGQRRVQDLSRFCLNYAELVR